ncbi:hypothetical protein C5Y96_00030 [Blastopirellula marina]|uniref:Helix-turn-helix domain-containing protein n=1 Tax=Blastopirellula marina TaxID=124 RepID=A0A2S8GBI5_9BACT|nr:MULTISPECIES: helix-turn-helix domain-containing protein [Pirellulaceae]PQO41797.1 hypothetical protein C5Y96_00030 [Blastopirellula marina]RCS56349.1 DNA-binding protein [Bremerella cremea]
MNEIIARLERIESLLFDLSSERVRKEYYTISEVAQIVGRSEYTVREWARHHRILAEKSRVGCGNSTEWRVSHEELTRIQNEGPLPIRKQIG